MLLRVCMYVCVYVGSCVHIRRIHMDIVSSAKRARYLLALVSEANASTLLQLYLELVPCCDTPKPSTHVQRVRAHVSRACSHRHPQVQEHSGNPAMHQR